MPTEISKAEAISNESLEVIEVRKVTKDLEVDHSAGAEGKLNEKQRQALRNAITAPPKDEAQ